MEGGVDRAIGGVTEFVKATADAGALTKSPFPRFAAPADRQDAEDRARPGEGRREHQPAAQPRRQRHHVRRGRERRRSARRHRRDALQVEGRHAPRRRRRRRRRIWGMTRAGVQAEGRPVAAQPRRRADQLDDRREQGRPRARARDRGGEGHRRAVARRRHAARRVLDDQRRRRARRSMKPAWENAIQQVLAACKEFNVPCGFPANAERHRDAHEAGLQRVRDELGRRRLQGRRPGRAASGTLDALTDRDRSLRAEREAELRAGAVLVQVEHLLEVQVAVQAPRPHVSHPVVRRCEADA